MRGSTEESHLRPVCCRGRPPPRVARHRRLESRSRFLFGRSQEISTNIHRTPRPVHLENDGTMHRSRRVAMAGPVRKQGGRSPAGKMSLHLTFGRSVDEKRMGLTGIDAPTPELRRCLRDAGTACVNDHSAQSRGRQPWRAADWRRIRRHHHSRSGGTSQQQIGRERKQRAESGDVSRRAGRFRLSANVTPTPMRRIILADGKCRSRRANRYLKRCRIDPHFVFYIFAMGCHAFLSGYRKMIKELPVCRTGDGMRTRCRHAHERACEQRQAECVLHRGCMTSSKSPGLLARRVVGRRADWSGGRCRARTVDLVGLRAQQQRN